MRQKDLLGRVRRTRKPRLEFLIERHDRNTMPARLQRLKWLQKVFPSGRGFLMPMDSAYVFNEAKDTFLDGHYVSTLLLACAFFEHRLGSLLEAHGYEKEASSGLQSILKTLRKHGLVNDYLLTQADRLRERRNPFVHLKEFQHPHTVDQRSLRSGRDVFELLAEDARMALSLVYQLALEKGITRPLDGYGLRVKRPSF